MRHQLSNYWPGTKVPISRNNFFNWRQIEPVIAPTMHNGQPQRDWHDKNRLKTVQHWTIA